MSDVESLLDDLYNAVLDGQAPAAKKIVGQLIEQHVAAETILYDGMIPAMDEVGRLFETGEVFVPEMLVSANAMKAGMELLQPLLELSDVKPLARIVLGTVQGDIHDIGKNLVGMMLKGAGFEVIDLGVNVPPARFVSAVEGASIIGLSALLTTTMPNMKVTIDALTAAGVRDRVKVIVGGAPVTEEFALEIGADGYASNANQAVTISRALLGIEPAIAA
ncbi:MAG: corrinoid methyltransferase [Chloroflexota bacterium]|nr:MAG: corrinoid methyltransferase [Chloroflexota bacterium]